MNGPGLLAVLTVSAFLFAGCNRNEGMMPKIDTEKKQQAPQIEAKKAGSEDKANAPQAERDAYLKMAREDIDQLKSMIDDLQVKAKNSSADLKAKLEKDIQTFQEDLKGIEQKLDDLKNAGAIAWQEMKTSFASSLEKLKAAIRKRLAN